MSFAPDGTYVLGQTSAYLTQLFVNDYNYTNISIEEAKIQQEQLLAKLTIADPHLNMSSVVQLYLGAAPSYQVQAIIDHADLAALHLSGLQNDRFSAKLNLGIEGPSWSSLVGFASLRDFKYSANNHAIQSELAQVHYRQQNDYTNIDLSSSILDFSIEGVLAEETLLDDLTHHLAILYPPIEGEQRSFMHTNANFEFSLLARNTRELLNIFLPDLDLANGTIVNGAFDSKN